MDLQEQLANRLSLFLLLIFCGSCSFSENTLQLNFSETTIDLNKNIVVYNNVPYSGNIYAFYPNSSDTLWSRSYKEGLKQGVWKKYFSNGKLQESRRFDIGKKEGDYLGYYNDGSKNFIFQFKNGEYNGTNKVWTKGGALIEEANFKAGYEQGVQKRWYLNGKIKSNYIIKNNRRYGLLGTKNCITVSDSIKKS
tara:strand:- start:929 stop:1510 length:582 start_codon:yes stop_codon:yes gene_type:complete